jgi:DNA repair exonuclease SbcCD ATPase subunit
MTYARTDCPQVLDDFIRDEQASKAAAQPPASELPRVVRAFLQARSLLSKRAAATAAVAAKGPKVLHLKDSCALPDLEEHLHLQSNIDAMQLTISSLEEQLHQQQQELLEYHSRAEGLEESIENYEQLLQQSASDMEQLKSEHAAQLQNASQERAAALRSLQLRNGSEQAAALEAQRLDELRQQLQKQLLQLQEDRAELNAQRSAIEMKASTAEVALSTVANQRATMHVQHSQLNADSSSASDRLRLQQVSVVQCMMRHTDCPVPLGKSRPPPPSASPP